MRRASFVAPLLLIGIGLLFLARNLYPDLPLIDYLAKYWPFLLIGWGVLRLAEILFWAANSSPLPAHGVSGGEWVLVIFVCIFGASVHAARGISTWWPQTNVSIGGLDMFGEAFEYPISGEKPSSKTPRVVIESFRGNVRIQGGDGDQVKVTGHKTIRSFNQGVADRANQDSPFELAGDANNVVVRTNQDRVGGNLRITEEMEITVPRGASIDGHGRNGDFDLTSIGGSVEITSDNAGVRLQDIGGNARMDLRRSDIVRAVNVKGALDLKGGRGSDIDLQNIDGQVTIAGSYNGVVQFRNLNQPLRMTGPMGLDLNIEKIPGQVRMVLGDLTASNLVGPIHISCPSRDVRLTDFTNSLELSVSRGDIELRPGTLPLARMDVRTHSGDITLALPPAAKFDLTASTSRGDVTNDFGSPLTADSSGRGSVLRGSMPGGSRVSVQTDRGEVVVRKASTDDKPSAPKSGDPAPPLRKLDQ
jgi:DUF4097 and DUF4098 domain-containing protein YvlB